MPRTQARAALDRCELRFPLGEARECANRYSYDVDDDRVIDAIAPQSRHGRDEEPSGGTGGREVGVQDASKPEAPWPRAKSHLSPRLTRALLVDEARRGQPRH